MIARQFHLLDTHPAIGTPSHGHFGATWFHSQFVIGTSLEESGALVRERR